MANDKLCHVPEMTRPVSFCVHRGKNGVLGFLLPPRRYLRGRNTGQRIPRRREIGKIEAERFRFYVSLDSRGVKLTEEVARFGQRSGTHSGYWRRTGKASSRLLKQHNIAEFRRRPDCGDKPAARLQHPDDFAGRSFTVHHVHHAETGEHYTERTAFGGNRFRSSFQKKEILEACGSSAPPGESKHF